MKLFKTLFAAVLISMAPAQMLNASVSAVYVETPPKTIVIKHPAAADVNKFFSEATMLNFEVYKGGSSAEFMEILKSFKENSEIESVSEGAVNGDYHAITISLKSAKSKKWFAEQFKKAGLTHIKINNNPIVEIDKM